MTTIRTDVKQIELEDEFFKKKALSDEPFYKEIRNKILSNNAVTFYESDIRQVWLDAWQSCLLANNLATLVEENL